MHLIRLILTLLFLVSTAQSQTVSEEGASPLRLFRGPGFELKYPNSMTEEESGTPSIPLLLRAQGGYPSLNILVQAGRPPYVRLGVKGQAKELVDSYNAVGFLDVRVVDSQMLGGVYKATLQYELREVDYYSIIEIHSGRHNHYISTYVDSREGFTKNLPLYQSLMQGFRVTKTPLEEKDNEDLFPFYLILGVLSLVIIGFGVKRLRRQ